MSTQVCTDERRAGHLIDLGQVTGLSASPDRVDPDLVWLSFRTPQAGRMQFRITRYVARVICFNLTTTLFPHTIGTLTGRMATAAIRPARSFSTVRAVRMYVNEQARLIGMTGINAVTGVHLTFSFEDAEELWTTLVRTVGFCD
ncbi:MAG: hypothetical protein Kow00124_16460 [Anaerolineae bacterium]